MAINYTSLLGLAKPVTGTEAGQWGEVINDQITSLLESAVAGAVTLDVTSGNVTLTTTTGAANQARAAILLVTGTPGTSRNIVAPSTSKVYVVVNGSDGAVVIKGSATTGVTIAAGDRSLVAWNGSDFVLVASGDVDGPASSTNNNIVLFNGTTGKIIKDGGQGLPSGTIVGTTDSQTLTNKTINGANNTISNISLASQVTGTLPVGNGGTGATSLTANNVILGNGGSAVQFVAPSTNGNVLKSNGTTWTSAAEDAQVYPGAGMAVSTGSAWGTSKTTPTGNVVGTSDTQTLSGKTITNLIFDGNYTEEVFAISDGGSVDLNPANGTIQTWTLGANRTPTANSFAAGQSITLLVNDGTDYTITWPSVTWVGGSAPTLATSGFTVIELWKVSTTLYGALVGSVA